MSLCRKHVATDLNSSNKKYTECGKDSLVRESPLLVQVLSFPTQEETFVHRHVFLLDHSAIPLARSQKKTISGNGGRFCQFEGKARVLAWYACHDSLVRLSRQQDVIT